MTTRIRILHVIPSLDVGGMENGVVNLVNGLPAGRFEHHIACLLRSGPLAGRIKRRAGITELRAGRHDPTATWRLARAIARYRPHVIHARNWNCWPDAAVARFVAGCGHLIWSIHGWTTDQRMSPTRALACRQLARWTDRLCAVCRDAAERFAAETGIPAGRFEVLYNGVDAERFRPLSAAARAAMRAASGWPADAVVIGAVGRLDPIKNYELLIEAIARVVQRPNAEPEAGNGRPGPTRPGSVSAGASCERGNGGVILAFVGDGPEEPRLREAAARTGTDANVRFLGRRADVPSLVGAFDVFALTSRREGMSNAILEAMACGLPVVATRVGGNAEMVVDGQTGLLIQSGDAEGLAAALQRLIARPDERALMGAAGRRRVEAFFTLQSMMERYADLYERMSGVKSEKVRK